MSSRITADDVHSGLHGSGDALLKSLGEMMMGRDICDGSAIGDYVPLESPIVPEKFAKTSRVGASGLSVHGIARTHDLTTPCLPYPPPNTPNVTVPPHP